MKAAGVNFNLSPDYLESPGTDSAVTALSTPIFHEQKWVKASSL